MVRNNRYFDYKKIIPGIILFLLILGLFFPILDFKKIIYAGDFTGSDLTELNVPLRYLLGQFLKNGQIPLWTQSLSGGFPLLAEGQSGVFYPFNLILFGFFDLAAALNLGLIINFFLGGLFVYIYARNLKISKWGALLAAMAFSLSGFFVFRVKHLNLINAAIWLPLGFYLADKFFQVKRKAPIIFLLSLVLAIQFLAGHPQISYISIISLFLYCILKYFTSEHFGIKSFAKKIILPWLAIGLIFFGLIAVQLLPTYFHSSLSGRGQAMAYQNAVAFPYKLSSLVYFVAPYFFGNPALDTYPADIGSQGIFWENNIYFGILPLIFSFLAVIFLFSKNKGVKILLILGAITFLFILGDRSPLFIIFWSIVPGFKMFRFYERFLLVTLLCLTVLAGFGFDFIREKLMAWQNKSGKAIRSKMLFKTLLPVALILITAIDLYRVDLNYFGLIDYSKYFSPPQSAQFLKQDRELFRIYSYGWPEAWNYIKQQSGGWQNNMSLFIEGRELIWPNLNVFWGLDSIDDRAAFEGGMTVKEIQQLRSTILQGGFKADEKNSNNILVARQALKILGMENVKYILSYKTLDNENLKLIKETKTYFLPPLKIYQNQFFLPRFRAVFNMENIAGSEVLKRLADNNFYPQSEIILEQNIGFKNPDANHESSAEIITTQSDDINLKFSVNYQNEGFLFLSQAFYPGWQARVDGIKQPIYRANFAFQAVRVPAGRHEISFSFQPISYIISLWITIATVILLLSFSLFYLIFYRKKLPKVSLS